MGFIHPSASARARIASGGQGIQPPPRPVDQGQAESVLGGAGSPSERPSQVSGVHIIQPHGTDVQGQGPPKRGRVYIALGHQGTVLSPIPAKALPHSVPVLMSVVVGCWVQCAYVHGSSRKLPMNSFTGAYGAYRSRTSREG